MSIAILHFNRNPAQLFTAAADFARVHGVRLRRAGQGSGNSTGASILVYEWQVDILDHLPLYILGTSHVVIPVELVQPFCRIIKRSRCARLKWQCVFF